MCTRAHAKRLCVVSHVSHVLHVWHILLLFIFSTDGCVLARYLIAINTTVFSEHREEVKVALKTVRKFKRWQSAYAVWVPKVKIVVSMLQVQVGIAPAFHIELPAIFTDFLEFVDMCAAVQPRPLPHSTPPSALPYPL
jgi:hypothetical protein